MAASPVTSSAWLPWDLWIVIACVVSTSVSRPVANVPGPPTVPPRRRTASSGVAIVTPISAVVELESIVVGRHQDWSPDIPRCHVGSPVASASHRCTGGSTGRRRTGRAGARTTADARRGWSARPAHRRASPPAAAPGHAAQALPVTARTGPTAPTRRARRRPPTPTAQPEASPVRIADANAPIELTEPVRGSQGNSPRARPNPSTRSASTAPASTEAS